MERLGLQRFPIPVQQERPSRIHRQEVTCDVTSPSHPNISHTLPLPLIVCCQPPAAVGCYCHLVFGILDCCSLSLEKVTGCDFQPSHHLLPLGLPPHRNRSAACAEVECSMLAIIDSSSAELCGRKVELRGLCVSQHKPSVCLNVTPAAVQPRFFSSSFFLM